MDPNSKSPHFPWMSFVSLVVLVLPILYFLSFGPYLHFHTGPWRGPPAFYRPAFQMLRTPLAKPYAAYLKWWNPGLFALAPPKG